MTTLVSDSVYGIVVPGTGAVTESKVIANKIKLAETIIEGAILTVNLLSANLTRNSAPAKMDDLFLTLLEDIAKASFMVVRGRSLTFMEIEQLKVLSGRTITGLREAAGLAIDATNEYAQLVNQNKSSVTDVLTALMKVKEELEDLPGMDWRKAVEEPGNVISQ